MRIRLAVQALKLLIQNLPYGSKFNVVSFGSTYQLMYPESVEYNDKTLEESFRIINNFDADMGSIGVFDSLRSFFYSTKETKCFD